MPRIQRVLIANRGEIACRIARSCKSLGIVSIAIYSKADRSSLHVRQADEAYLLPGDDSSAYIDEDAVLEIARKSGAHAVIPGYGFLSERDKFAERVEQAGLTWVGPSSEVIRQFGLKHTARELAIKAGVPVIQGTDLLSSPEEALEAASRIGYPVMLKATAGGGGMGLQICHTADDVAAAFRNVTDRGATLFSNSSMFMEKYVARSRHVEVQIFGNGLGGACHFGERECSIQRRHQKVIEEAPSPFVHGRPGMREKMTSCAVALAKSCKYGSAGTVEFLVDDTDGSFYFLEVNTRLQVEHGITEMCYDVDLVSLMLRQAERPIDEQELLSVQKDAPHGYAIEARVYAEIPSRNYAPSPGLLQNIEWVDDARVDTWVTSGTNISPYYDPMIAKVLVWAETHDEATKKMIRALTQSKVQGCPTNIHFLADIVNNQRFSKGDTTTAFLDTFSWRPSTVDIVSAGAYTTIQDLPARRGVTNGVPESGPMDAVSFRVANLIAGNAETTEGLEVTLIGPELLFNVSATVAVTGGVVDVSIDGRPADMYTRLHVPAGSKLKIGQVRSGCRSYVAIKGGFPNVPVYLGSKSTTSTLGLGGYQGRQLQPSDALDIVESPEPAGEISLPTQSRLDGLWEDSAIHVMPGPHDDPEFITEEDRKFLYDSVWKISHNATRSGYQVKGPHLSWAREDGGEGGGHPSNIIDEPYFIGAMNWNGDNPVILPNDAPMAGGLAMTHTVIRADMWRLGQRRPGAEIQFKRVTWESAVKLRQRTERYVAEVKAFVESGKGSVAPPDVALPADFASAIIHEISEPLRVVYRQAGEASISVSYGPMTASALTRAHIQQVLLRIRGGKEVKGVIASTGTTRAYSVEFDPLETSQSEMLQQLLAVERSVVNAHDLIPSRLFRFPILFDDPVSKQAVRDYMATVRDSAIYLPDNQEYIAKANGVDVDQASKSIVSCPQLVTEVSFVVGCPLLLPLDPRSVYVAQKYNPVRSFTPEGTVGMWSAPLSECPSHLVMCRAWWTALRHLPKRLAGWIPALRPDSLDLGHLCNQTRIHRPLANARV